MKEDKKLNKDKGKVFKKEFYSFKIHNQMNGKKFKRYFFLNQKMSSNRTL